MLGLLLSLASALLFSRPSRCLTADHRADERLPPLVPYIGLPLALGAAIMAALPASKSRQWICFLPVSVAMLHLLAFELSIPKL